MLHYFFQTYFIYILCAFISVNHAIAQEHAAGEADPLTDIKGRGKCTAENCTCIDVPQWNGVDCYHIYQSPFPRLDFRRFKYLPERMFLGLRIYDVWLWDSDVTVEENVLEGILGLDAFVAEKSSIEVVPDLRIVKDSLKSVAITSSRLISLEGKHLQNLTSVRLLLFYNNFIRFIDPDAFWGTDNVEHIDLSRNKLTSIPPRLLNPMRFLATFSASHNNLLHVHNLFSVTRPTWIKLAFNNITNFSLPENAKNFLAEFFIADLDLSYNFINKTSLSLSTSNFETITKICNLNLNGNELLNLRDHLQSLQLNILEIIGNSIHFLSEKDFISVYQIEELHLRANQIRRIDTDTFKHFEISLLGLDLSFNKITSINASVKYLSNLQWLNLSHNSIQIFAEDEFTGIHSLSSLYLQHNEIKSLGTALQKLKKLKDLNIAHNDIKLINPLTVFGEFPSKKYINIEGNPMKCQCHILPFIEILIQEEETGLCLRSKIENRLRKRLNCPDMCSCECIEYEDGFSIFINCSSRNLSLLPHLVENNLSQLEVNETFSSDNKHYQVMYQNINRSLLLEGNILGISLENNRLDILDAAKLPPNLVQLYLSNNNLTRFPQSVIDSQLDLKEVTLSGNPWNCDCDGLKFKEWLTSNDHIIKDFGNVRCGVSDTGRKDLNGSVIWKLTDADLCPGTDFVMIISVSFLSFAIFYLFAKKMYRTYELSIKVYLYSQGITFVKEKFVDQDKVFDVFISFSHKDDEFVIKNIISEIEHRDPNIRLCLHYRHFRPGESIINNIAHAVQKSKMTLLILSCNFVKSEWCLLEFKSAILQTLHEKGYRVIAVKIGELPKEMDPAIKLHLDSTTYLTWGESNFWNKLLFVLPSQSCDKRPVLNFVGDNETVFSFSSSEL